MVAATPIASPTSSELVSKKRCHRWLQFGTGRRLPRLPRRLHDLARSHDDQGLGELARAGQERRVAAPELDGLDSELQASGPAAILRRPHAVVPACEVGRADPGPLTQ